MSIPAILDSISSLTIPFNPRIDGDIHNPGIAIGLLLFSVIACLVHFRFLGSSRIVRARLLARRRRKWGALLIEYPGRADIVGHLLLKILFPQLLYLLITADSMTGIYAGVVAAICMGVLIVYRQIQPFFDEARAQKRRYFLSRLGRSFAIRSLVESIFTRWVCLVLLFTCVSFGMHRLAPDAYTLPRSPVSGGELFILHAMMHSKIPVSSGVQANQTLSTVLGGFVWGLGALFFGLCIRDAKNTAVEKPDLKPALKHVTDNLSVNSSKICDVQAAISLIIEFRFGIHIAEIHANLLEQGFDSLGLIELQANLEEFFELHEIPIEQLEKAGTIGELAQVIAENHRQEAKTPSVC